MMKQPKMKQKAVLEDETPIRKASKYSISSWGRAKYKYE